MINKRDDIVINDELEDDLIAQTKALLDNPEDYIGMKLTITKSISSELMQVLEQEEIDRRKYYILGNMKIDFLDKYIEKHPYIDQAVNILKDRGSSMFSIEFHDEEKTEDSYTAVCKGRDIKTGEISVNMKSMEAEEDFTVNFQVTLEVTGNLPAHMEYFLHDMVGQLKNHLNLEVIDTGDLKLHDNQEEIVKFNMSTKIDPDHFDHTQAKKALMAVVAQAITMKSVVKKYAKSLEKLEAIYEQYKDVEVESEGEQESLDTLEIVIMNLNMKHRTSIMKQESLEASVQNFVTLLQVNELGWNLEMKGKLLETLRGVMVDQDVLKEKIEKMEEVKKEVQEMGVKSFVNKMKSFLDNVGTNCIGLKSEAISLHRIDNYEKILK